MNEPASDVIAARAHAQGTLVPTLVWSIAAHAAIVAAIWLAPARSSNDATPVVMTISLSGAPGPRSGGLTQMGDRAVPETPKPPEPPQPVARTPPPPPASRPVAALPAKTATAARPARSEPAPSAPTVPEPPREGSTRTDTGSRGTGFGLATGGNGQKGIEVETPNFCCPAYLELVRTAIERAWQRVPGALGTTTMRFRILRNGTIDSVSTVQSSNNTQIDNAAARALALVPNVPALPPEFPDSALVLRMRFENR